MIIQQIGFLMRNRENSNVCLKEPILKRFTAGIIAEAEKGNVQVGPTSAKCNSKKDSMVTTVMHITIHTYSPTTHSQWLFI